MLFSVPGDNGTLSFEATGTGGLIEFSGLSVSPETPDGTPLGDPINRWSALYTSLVDIDGDLTMTGNPTIRSVPYIFPVSQGSLDTELVNDGTGVLTWEPRLAVFQNGTNGAPVVNITNSPTVTWSRNGSNWTATASASGTSVYVNGTNVSNPNLKDSADITYALAASTNIQPSLKAQAWVNLTFSSSTNLNTMDCSLGSTEEVHFYTVLTNSAFLGTPSNIPTTVKHIWYHLQQDGTGLRTLTMTNGTFANPAQVPFVLSTNASAVDIIEMITDPFTNTVINVVGTQNFKR